MKKLASTLLSLAIISNVYAAETPAADAPTAVAPSYKHEGRDYPPVLFQTNIEDQSFKSALEGYGAFESLNDDSLGLPLGVLVLKNIRMKSDAKGISSLLLSASTLGIVPVMSNKEFSIRYDVFLQGKSVASYTYEMTSADVQNFWGGFEADKTLKPEQEIFLDQSIVMFLNDLKSNEEVQGYFAEYDSYFRP